MKPNTIKEMKEILDAIEQGKTIQYQSVHETHRNDWIDHTYSDAALNFFDYRYRIKPEEPKKKWRPFKDVDEFIKAAGGLVAIWLKDKENLQLELVTSINYRASFEPIRLANSWVCLSVLLLNYTFADGTPCGVEEDS